MKQKLLLLAILLSTTFTSAEPLKLPISTHPLSNGLQVLTVTDTTLPVVSCRLYYFTGSMYEGPGTSGLSHMYEHMMFKGTKRLGTNNYKAEIPLMVSIDSIGDSISQLQQKGVDESDSSIVLLRNEIFALLDSQRTFIKKDEIWSLYESNGGTSLNAWTSSDLVAYLVTLPYNKVELFANVEADRMQNIVLREFYSERDVVTEERRMRYENRPINNYFQRLFSKFFVANPYRIPTIGWYSDIRNYTRAKLENHIKQYYRPDNAMIILAGNITAEESNSLIAQYFEEIPNPKIQPLPVVTLEPAPLGVTKFEMSAETSPRVDMMFHTPGYGDSDLIVLDVIESMLNGKSGRLYKRLVLEEKVALSASAGNAYQLKDGYFHIGATLKEGISHDRVEKLILEELAKLSLEEPSEKELLRIKNSMELSFVTKLESMESLSDQLAYFQTLGSWKDMLSYQDRINEVITTTAVAKKYLNPDFRTVGYLKNIKGDK